MDDFFEIVEEKASTEKKKRVADQRNLLSSAFSQQKEKLNTLRMDREARVSSSEVVRAPKTIKEEKVRKKKKTKEELPAYSDLEADEIFLEPILPMSTATRLLGVDSINDGIILTTDGRYVKLLEIAPTNVQYRSDEDKDRIADTFTRMLSASKNSIHIKSMANPMDFTNYTDRLREFLGSETNENCKEFIRSEIEYIKDTANLDATQMTYVMAIEFTPDSRKTSDPKKRMELAYMQLNMYANTISGFLSQCGNTVVQHEYESVWVAGYLYSISNRSESLYSDVLDNIKKVNQYYLDRYGVYAKGQIDPSVYFAGKDMEFGKDYVYSNGLYYRYFCIVHDTLPAKVAASYMSVFTRLGTFIDCDFDLIRVDRKKARNDVARKMRHKRVSMNTMDSNSDNFLEEGDRLDAGQYIRYGLMNNEDLWYCSGMITVISGSKENLDMYSSQIVDLFAAYKIKIHCPHYAMKNCYQSSLPYNHFDKIIYRKSSQNVLTSDLGAWYVFTSSEYYDPNGILIGLTDIEQGNDAKTGSPVIVDIFNTSKFSNANIAVKGSSGSGKTYLLSCFATRLRMQGIKVFMIIPDKAVEYKRTCEAIGGTVISLGAQSKNNINCMDIRKVDSSAEVIDGESTYVSQMRKKINMLRRSFQMYNPSYTLKDIDLIDMAAIEAYRRKGITEDNDSLIDPDDPTRYREMPTLEDLYNILGEYEEGKETRKALLRLVKGSASIYSQHTNVPLDNDFILFDLSGLKDEQTLQSFTAYNIIEYIFDCAREDRTTKKAIIMDEMWQMIGHTANKEVAAQILRIFKEIRGYGGSAIYATQDFSDDNTPEGKGILAACKTKVILPLVEDEAKLVAESLNLSVHELEYIIDRERGNALFCIGHNNIPVKITASKKAHMLFTTDRKDLEHLKAQLLQQQKRTVIGSLEMEEPRNGYKESY